MKKPHKNAKLSHYEGNPWNKGPKPKTVKQIEKKLLATSHDKVIVEVDPLDFDHHKYTYFFINSKEDKWTMPETLVLFRAKMRKPHQFLVESAETQWVNGNEFLVYKHEFIKNPKLASAWQSFIYNPNFGFDIEGFRPTWATRDSMISERVIQFLDKPFPEPEPSLLVLPKEVEDQRRRAAHKEAFITFLENEVKYQLEPLRRSNANLIERNTGQEGRINYLAGEKTRLEEEIDSLQKQIEKLEYLKGRVESAMAATGERTRNFRDED